MAVDLAEMGSLSSKNWGVKYLLCVIDVFTKYARVKPLEDQKTITVLHGFIEVVNESNHKPNRLIKEKYFTTVLTQKWWDGSDVLI